MKLSYIDDIKSILKSIAKAGNAVEGQRTKSIARGANEQSFHFPCLVSDSVAIDSATTLSRMLDRMYAQFTQIYLSGVGIIDLDLVKNPKQFIAQYQSNFNFESAEDEEFDEEVADLIYDEYMEYLQESIFTGEPVIYMNKNKTAGIAITESEKIPVGLSKINKKNSEEYLSGFNTNGLLTEAEISKSDMINSYLGNKEDELSRKQSELLLKQSANLKAPQMANGDIKKVNDMQPFSLELKVFATKGESSLGQYITFNVGVKTFLHLVKSSDMAMNIAYVLRNNNKMFNFIKWTTGEISFFKDILLHVDDMNFDIANKTNGNKYFPILKRLKQNKFKLSGTRGITNKAPFATLVISTIEYNEVLNSYGYDLKNISIAKKLMNELFLMTFIIVDEGTQTIDVLFDHYGYGFQTYSLESLEREVSMSSNKLGKELTRMLGTN